MSVSPIAPEPSQVVAARSLAPASEARHTQAPAAWEIVRRGRVRAVVAMMGPAFVASVAYVDPGNFSTNFTAGAQYGYALVWVVVLANLMAMPVQFLSAKVGIVTGRSLPQVCRDHLHPVVRIGLWIQAEVVAVSTDLAEFVGAAIGLNLLFGVNPLAAGLITGAVAFALLAVQSRGYRPFERAMFALLLIVFAGFGYQLLHLGGAGSSELVASLVPQLHGSGMVYLAAGIIGATMMPHVVYLHSEMTRSRVRLTNDADRRSVLRFERWDVVVALGLAGLVNLSMIVIAAQLFFGEGAPDLFRIHQGLGEKLGGMGALAFAVALLASGISSSSVGTYAGQAVMAGFTELRIHLFVRRAVTMLPAMVVLAAGVDLTQVLNFSQVVLSFGIPFALVPLVVVTSSRRIMGSFVNPRWLIVTMSGIAVVVSLLNLTLLYLTFD